MSATPPAEISLAPREWSRTEVQDGVCTIILVLTHVEQLFDTDVPVPSEYVALDSDVLDFFAGNSASSSVSPNGRCVKSSPT